MKNQDLNENILPPADKRQYLRAPLLIQKIRVNGDRPAFFGYSKNISRSGLFIATTNQVNPGDTLELEIPLPSPIDQTVRCHCEVVWKRPFGKHLPFEPGIGLKFIDLPAEISQQIEGWIDSSQ